MAFTVTARHSGNSTTSGVATLATDSQTPTASSLFITAAGGERNSQVQAYSWQTPTGGGYTYTNLQVPNTSFDWVADSTFAVGGAVWRADVGGSPAAHTVTVDPHSTADTCFLGAVCFDITGHSSSTPVQSKAGGASVNPSSDTAAGTITLDSAPTSGNLIVVCWMVGGDVAGGVTSPTSNGQSFTSITNQTSANCHVSAFYRVATGAENATISTTDLGQSVGAYAVIAFEIAGGAAPSPSVPLQQWPPQLFGPWPRTQLLVPAESVAVEQQAATGEGQFGLSADATVKKVAKVSANCSLGLSGDASVKKIAKAVSNGHVGLAAQSTAKKVSTPSASGQLGLASLATAKKVSKSSGTSSVGLSANFSHVQIAVVAANCSLGVVGLATAKKVSTPAAPGLVGLAGLSTVKKIARPALNGAVGLTGSASVKKVSTPTASALAGLVGLATVKKVGRANPNSSFGLTSWLVRGNVRNVTAFGLLGLATLSTAKKRSTPGAVGAVGLLGINTAVTKKSTGSVARVFVGLSGDVTAKKKQAITARALVGLSSDATFVLVVLYQGTITGVVRTGSGVTGAQLPGSGSVAGATSTTPTTGSHVTGGRR